MDARPAVRLTDLELFADCTKVQLREIGGLTTLVHVPAGRILMKEGSAGRDFVVVGNGRARVTRESIDGIHTVADVAHGDIIGEMSLLTGMPRTATVTAITDVDALVSSLGEFNWIMRVAPSVARRVQRTFQVRAQENDLAAA